MVNIGLHISHEAAKKIGGIGSVLSGICNTEIYHKRHDRTLFYGPLFDDHSAENPDRLGPNSKTLFSSLDNLEKGYPLLSEICHQYHVDIAYGTKKVYDEINPEQSREVEIVLAGIKRLKIEEINKLKFRLWERFGFQSELYHDWDFEQYLRIAVPLIPIIKALTDQEYQLTAFSHEYMGVVCCLELLMAEDLKAITYFHAHEVSTARAITEKLSGHDIAFYHFLKSDTVSGLSMEERFGSQKSNYRSELIKLAVNFDGVLAVGDWVKQEYQYLQPAIPADKIKIVYNGVPTNDISFETKIAARKRIISYCDTLFNFEPDVIFTHVTRLVTSKGLWRDIKLLEELDKIFAQKGIKGFYLLLSSLISTGRKKGEISQMEEAYGWPVLHREGYPDLIDYEKEIYNSCSIFNAKSRAIKALFINQYGFNREVTGTRVPEESTFSDLRYGSDVELGFSVYEPFGIAQIETVPYGGLAFLSRQCGCSFLLDKAYAEESQKPYYCIDFSEVKDIDEKELMNMSFSQRSEIESKLFAQHANNLFAMLPKNREEREKLFIEAKKFVRFLSWEDNLRALWSDVD